MVVAVIYLELRGLSDKKKNSTAMVKRYESGQKCGQKTEKKAEKRRKKAAMEMEGEWGWAGILQPEPTMVKLNSASFPYTRCLMVFSLQ